MAFLKKIVVIALIVAVLYALLGYHFILVDSSIKILKKTNLSLKYTIFSTKGKRIETVLSIPELWEDGIGELLLKEGKISEEKLDLYRIKMEGDDDEEY